MLSAMLTLAEAAQQIGLHRSNLLRAIKSGRISGTRDDNGAWRVDPGELVRVFPEARTASRQPEQAVALLQLKLEHSEQRLADLTRQLERALCDIADWKEQARRPALPAPSTSRQLAQPAEAPPPSSRLVRAWRWLRSTG